MIVERDAYWSRLLLSLADGRPEGVAALKAMDTVEFWHFYNAYQERQQQIADAYKQS